MRVRKDSRKTAVQIMDSGKKKYAEAKRLIRNAMQEGQLVLFVGSGASKGAGMPLWKEAVSQIIKKLDLEKDCSDDSLVIPQYYYNARGRKEYTQLMREIFRYNDKLNPGPIHDAVIRFEAETIITTNYDHLIEQAAENNGEFLYVVSKDSDLPYKKAGKELIKMHGDFENDNFVLKEDDYLHYHQHFKLVENYVKSLIGTKTVLFLGYSFSDPDVKHIFSWVKEILDEHFQRAYMVITGKESSQNEIEYFRHLGVNIIYPTELFSKDEIKSSDHSKQLLQTLNYLLDDEESKKSIIDSLYDYLKPFSSLRYTYKKYVETAFNRVGRKNGSTITLYIDNDDYVECSSSVTKDVEQKFLMELEKAIDGKSDDQKIQTIADALRKSEIKGIKFERNDGSKKQFEAKKYIDDLMEQDWARAIRSFDYAKLNNLRESNFKILSESKPERYLQQAYICSFLGDYLSAYYCLDNAMNYFYRRREYAWYFISLWNKRNVAQIITWDFLYYRMRVPQDIMESIKNDLDSINIDKTLQTIPDLGNDNNRFLKELKDYKFASDLFYDVVSDSVRASRQANEMYCLFAGLPAYERMRKQVYDYYQYTMNNYLFVDRYRENNEIYSLYVRSLFASVSAPDKRVSDNGILGNTGNVHAESLTTEDIHLILRYTNTDDLRKLFNEFSINIVEVDENGKKYLKNLITKLSPVFELNLDQGKDIFWRYVRFISHTRIDAELSSSVLRVLANLPKSEYSKRQQPLEEFTISLHNQQLYKHEELCLAAKELVITLIDVIAGKKENLDHYRSSVVFLLGLCDTGGICFDDEDSIKKLLSEDYYLLLAQIYAMCADNVKSIIQGEFSQWTCPDTGMGYQIYSSLILAGLKEPDETIENMALGFVSKQNENRKQEREQGIITFSADNVVRSLINLYWNESLLNVGRLKEIVSQGDDEYAIWMLDIEGYNYNTFDFSWLMRCSQKLIEKIAENKKARNAILSAYKEKYPQEFIDKRVHETILKYFI